MEISEVRVKLVGDSGDRLRAFCSITLEGDFVIRDLKIIDGATGPFVAMPSRKLADRCPQCRGKNHLRARFCNNCGVQLRENRVARDREGRNKLHADIAHPINSECRAQIQERVVEAYHQELARSKQPGYVPQDYDDDGLSDYDELLTPDYQPRDHAAPQQPAAPSPESADTRSEAHSGSEPSEAPVGESSEAGGKADESPDSGEQSFGQGIL